MSREADLSEAMAKSKNKGFSFTEPDDHLLQLYHLGVEVAMFSQVGVTADGVNDACVDYLKKIAGIK